MDWEDYVEPGFEREKEEWLRLNRQLSGITPKPPIPSQQRPPCPADPDYQNSLREKAEMMLKEEEKILKEVEQLKSEHPFKYFLIRNGMPRFAGARRDVALRINPGLRGTIMTVR